MIFTTTHMIIGYLDPSGLGFRVCGEGLGISGLALKSLEFKGFWVGTTNSNSLGFRV